MIPLFRIMVNESQDEKTEQIQTTGSLNSDTSLVGGTEIDENSSCIGNIFRKLIPAGLPEDESKRRCDYRSPSVVPQEDIFNYSRFTLYLQLHNQRERQLRILLRRRGKNPDWLHLEYYTDSVLQQELEGIYGEMNTNSSEYAKLFRNYKLERLEEIEDWILEEFTMIKECFDAGGRFVNPAFTFPSNEVIDFAQTFSPEELDVFDLASQRNKHIERFRLPRPSIDHSSHSQFTEMPREIRIEKELASNIQTVVHPHITGITPSQLNKKYRHFCDEDLDYQGHGCQTVEDMCLKLSPLVNIHKIPNTRNGLLLYPSYTKNLICNPYELLGSICHKFRSIVTLSKGIISVSHAVTVFQDVFKFQLNPERLCAWGFSTEKEMLSSLLNIFQPRDLVLRSSHELFLPGDTSYLILSTSTNASLLDAQLAKVHEAEAKKLAAKAKPSNVTKWDSTNHLLGARIPADCMQLGDSIDMVTREFTETFSRKALACVMLHYYTPSDFYVSVHQYWDQLQNFQEHMTKTYEMLDAKNCGDNLENIRPNSQNLIPGLYIAVLHFDEERKERDYYRGRYLEKTFDGLHKVFQVDYGDVITVPISNIRYLKKFVAHELRLQAIWCGLHNILPQEHWRKEIVDNCYDMMYHDRVPFHAKFMNSISINGKEQWLIRATGANVKKYPDVGQALIVSAPSLEVRLKNT